MFSKHTCSLHGKTRSANIFSEFSKQLYTFENLNLRQTVTELQELCDVFIRNTQISVLLGTVEGGRSFLPLCQISGTGFCCKDRKRISVQGCLSHNKEHSNFFLCRKTSTFLRLFLLINIFRVQCLIAFCLFSFYNVFSSQIILMRSLLNYPLQAKNIRNSIIMYMQMKYILNNVGKRLSVSRVLFFEEKKYD